VTSRLNPQPKKRDSLCNHLKSRKKCLFKGGGLVPLEVVWRLIVIGAGVWCLGITTGSVFALWSAATLGTPRRESKLWLGSGGLG
jgi:hypothetical protein